MLQAALLAMMHHLAAFLLVACIAVEWFILNGRLTSWDLRRLPQVDLLYGICAGVVLAAGFIRALAFEKGWDYYAVNLAFQLNVGLFLVAWLVSVYPTICFVRWGRMVKQQGGFKPKFAEVRRIRWCLNLELMLLCGVMLCSALMAKGLGMPEG